MREADSATARLGDVYQGTARRARRTGTIGAKAVTGRLRSLRYVSLRSTYAMLPTNSMQFGEPVPHFAMQLVL